MTRRRTAAEAAEEAELRTLSEQAELSRHELGETVQALTEKIASETDIRVLARRQAGHIAAAARHAASDAARRPAIAGGQIWTQATRSPHRGVYARAAVIVVPAVVLAAVMVAWQARGRGHR